MAKSRLKADQKVVLALRLSMGWLMLYAGITKILQGGWTATGFLQNVAYGPFKGFFLLFAQSALVDALVMYGLTLIGLALILGLLVRWASFWGIVLMALFYLPRFPPQTGAVEEHVIYALVFGLLMAAKAGTQYGLDAILEKKDFIKNHDWLRWVLG